MRPDIKTIVCSVDFSMHTPPVFQYGLELARMFGARLVVFHSVYFRQDRVFHTDGAENREHWRQLPVQALEKIRSYMVNATVDWEAAIEHGEPVSALKRVAADQRADLIVAASHGLSGFQRLFLGTVIERAVRSIPTPMLVLGHRVRGVPSSGLKGIVAGCGLRVEHDPVTAYATCMARCFRADLHLVHVSESPVNESVIDPAEGPYTRVQNELKHRLKRLLVQSAGEDPLLPTPKTSVLTGLPAESLARYAADEKAEMLVVGVQQSEALKRTLLGSTVESLLRQMPCSLLAVPLEGTEDGHIPNLKPEGRISWRTP